MNPKTDFPHLDQTNPVAIDGFRYGLEMAAKALTERSAGHYRNGQYAFQDECIRCAWMMYDMRPTAPAPDSTGKQGQEPSGFPERDQSKRAEDQGIFRKFEVRRTDGSSEPGGKHENCRYFVLDLNHDHHARAAMRAYATSCRSTHPVLCDEIEAEFGSVFREAAETEHQAEEAKCLHMWLDDKGVPRKDADGPEFSLVGRVAWLTYPTGAQAQVLFHGEWKPATEEAFYCASEKNRRVVDRAAPVASAEPLGICCYGGPPKPKSSCASCAAWQPRAAAPVAQAAPAPTAGIPRRAWSKDAEMMDSWSKIGQAEAAAPAAEPTDEQIIAALHSCGIDTHPSKHGFDAVQVSATSVPSLRAVLQKLRAAPAVSLPGHTDELPPLPWGDDFEAWLEPRRQKDVAQAFHDYAREYGKACASAASAQPVTDERAAFEAWAVSNDGGWLPRALERNPAGSPDDYRDDNVQAEWRAWQARAALAAAPLNAQQGGEA
ncbi:hypothetical protein [Massilia sp. DD77]|uniref:hypothetical protein n=1 Tax=Massilia sp. DD77 TaxID=3109349 RepID=UPI002FFF9A91